MKRNCGNGIAILQGSESAHLYFGDEPDKNKKEATVLQLQQHPQTLKGGRVLNQGVTSFAPTPTTKAPQQQEDLLFIE